LRRKIRFFATPNVFVTRTYSISGLSLKTTCYQNNSTQKVYLSYLGHGLVEQQTMHYLVSFRVGFFTGYNITGLSVGIKVGRLVGNFVGRLVGLVVIGGRLGGIGCVVDDSEGDFVPVVGLKTGCFVGEFVGFGEGLVVRSFVGRCVG
jgi:hypothetical protein